MNMQSLETTTVAQRVEPVLVKLPALLRPRRVATLATSLALPVLGMLVFVLLWAGLASHVHTSLGTLPGPAEVLAQSRQLLVEHRAERAKEAEFYARQEARYQAQLAKDPQAKRMIVPYTGAPTFFDQIITSIKTVATGFLLGTLLAIPLGIICGLSGSIYKAMNPLIQIFKPISPLAWLPIVTMVVSAVYVSPDPMFAKSFVTSAFTVMLCCLWPTLINTTIGVSSVSRDLVNVARVLRLGWFTKVRKIVLPSAVPMIFAGLRVSLGIGWMVLIATEMLAQNPGLGKFVWDEFQNGSSSSLARILVAVFAIGFIGYALDRLMLALQQHFSWDRQAVLR